MNPFTVHLMAAFAMMIVFGANDATAVPILDQFLNPSVTTLAEVDEGVDHAQTFTVDISGLLGSLDVLLCKGANTTQDLLVDVRRTVGGVPTESDQLANDSVLASARVPNSAVLVNQVQFIHIDISSFNVQVSAGDVLALVLRPSEPLVVGDNDGYGWGGALDGNLYAEGTRYSRISSIGIPWESFPARDMGFAIYIGAGIPPPLIPQPPGSAVAAKPPEPATVVLVGTGAAVLFACTRIRRRR